MFCAVRLLFTITVIMAIDVQSGRGDIRGTTHGKIKQDQQRDLNHKEDSQTCKSNINYSSNNRRNCRGNSFRRRDGVRVGHTQTVQVAKGRHHIMLTKSLKPLIFEIPDFLTSSECDHIIGLAQVAGLQESTTISDEKGVNKLKPDLLQLQKSRYRRVGKRFGNQFKSLQQFKSFLQQAAALYLYEKDVEKIFMAFDEDFNRKITEDELIGGTNEIMDKFIYLLEDMKFDPLYRSRYSSQTWLAMNESTDTVLQSLKERIIRLTNLPQWVIEASEPLQVVKYSVHGHFHGHYDSTEDDIGNNLPCCQALNNNNDCHMCRYMTILFFMNDVLRGGETAFLVADAKRVHQNVSTNLSINCHNSNLVIKPQKGTAVMWYNHFLDPKTGLLGKLDRHSLHGGCDVLEGDKWIVNSWINLPKGN